MPPQPATPQSHNSDNIHSQTQSQKTPQSSPTTQSKQQTPVRTNTNPAPQPFIPAAETHQPMSSSPLQHIPKSVNGEGVKSSKPESRSSAPAGRLCFHCKQPGHLKKDCPEQPYCSKCRMRGHIPAKCHSKQQGRWPTYEGREFREEGSSQSHETHREEWKRSQDQPHFSHKTTDVSTVLVTAKLVIALQDNNNRLPPLAPCQWYRYLSKHQSILKHFAFT